MLSLKKIHLIAGALLLALVHQSLGDSSVGNGSFTVTSETNTTKPKTIFKPTVTRAELKVSRSLNPDSMQKLNVLTNDGKVATILVKKRDGKTSVNNEPRKVFYDVSNQFSRGEVRRGLFGPIQVLERLDDTQVQKLHQQQKQLENGRVYSTFMQPVITLQQQQTLYHHNPYDSYRFAQPNDEKSINLINSFMKHVQQVESTRHTRDSLRNDRAQIYTKIPEPVTINSETVYVKDQNSAKRARSLMEIDSDGIPVINGVRVPDDENDKRQTWRNARVINGELVPYENGYVPPRTVEYGQLIYPVKKSDVEARQKSIGPFTTADNFSEELEGDQSVKSDKGGIGPFSVTDMFTSRSNSKNSGIGPFSVADNSRSSNAKLIDYIKRINDQENRKDYFARTPKDSGSAPKIQRRMLINPGNTYFPPSSRYSIEKSKQSESISAAPILQYAHPEFGLQSVGSYDQDVNQKSKKIEYYTNQNNFQRQRPNNEPVYQIEPALNTREYYNMPRNPAMYPHYQNYAYVRRVKPEQPFWMKITEQVRDTFHNGFAQVQEITKPVMDPIMEAGEKISHNLGFSHALPKHAQEKSAYIAPHQSNDQSTSYIFPALGMLAGGAALGLGAVAMGRIFDVSSLLTMRSSEETIDLEHKRALDAIRRVPTTTLFLVEDNKGDESAPQTAPQAKFYEVIAAIPQQSSSPVDSSVSIEPTSEYSDTKSHQRRKRN